MFELLWLIPLFPLAGFLILALGGKRLPRPAVALIAVGSIGLSTLVALVLGRPVPPRPAAGKRLSRDPLDLDSPGRLLPDD